MASAIVYPRRAQYALNCNLVASGMFRVLRATRFPAFRGLFWLVIFLLHNLQKLIEYI